MIYVRDNTSLCFFHIPRCAGRWLNYVLYFNEFKLATLDNHNEVIDGYEFMHLPKSLLDGLPEQQFAFVRDPVQRFLSAAGFHRMFDTYDLNNITFDKFFEAVYVEIKESPSKRQFLMPQTTFIDESVKTLKVESGLSECLPQWIKDNFNIDISMPDDAKTRRPVYDDADDLSLTSLPVSDNVKHLIQSFYHADYVEFNYPKNV